LKKLRASDGQAVVEFALVLPLVVILLFSVINFGLIFWRQITITDAARVLAREAAVARFNAVDPPCAVVTPAHVVEVAGDLAATAECDDTSTPGSVTVTVKYTQQIFGPLPFFDPTLDLESITTERLE
jgi:hypothetical protein